MDFMRWEFVMCSLVLDFIDNVYCIMPLTEIQYLDGSGKINTLKIKKIDKFEFAYYK